MSTNKLVCKTDYDLGHAWYGEFNGDENSSEQEYEEEINEINENIKLIMEALDDLQKRLNVLTRKNT